MPSYPPYGAKLGHLPTLPAARICPGVCDDVCDDPALFAKHAASELVTDALIGETGSDETEEASTHPGFRARTRCSDPDRVFAAGVAQLVRSYLRLPADVQKLVARGYRQCLMANHDEERARAARQAVLSDLIRGTGLTREQR